MRRRGQCPDDRCAGESTTMAGTRTDLSRDLARSFRRPALVMVAAAAVILPILATPSAARGPDGIADVAETVIDAVVNISTSQTVESKGGPSPQLPPGSPFEEFFEEFFKNRRGQGGDNQGRERIPRRVNSLGSGFVIDPAGIVVTNNHVISDAVVSNDKLNDTTKLRAEIIG